MDILRDILGSFRNGKELADRDAAQFFDALIADTDEKLLADVLTAWEKKGITEDELFALASIMREHCIRVSTKHQTFVDAVGTGGSKAKTFNVSTAAAFVVAGAGIPVAKHGNRAATSNSGSADVLEALGVNPSVNAATAEQCLDEIGICFMFAPNFHSLSPVLGKVRRGLGFPTIFNNLGPLCNPANAPHQLIGVWKEDMVEKTANVLAKLGTKKSWVVHGSDGLDELTLNSATKVAEIDDDTVRMFEMSPSDFGLDVSDMRNARVSTSEESAALIRGVLSGRTENLDAVNLVAINAAAAIYIASPGLDISKAFNKATESINSGAAAEKLRQLAELTNR
jgi:anthranilate phosphoribosyltransferase